MANPNHSVESVPAIADSTRELVVVIHPHDLNICEFLGTRAQLEAEGIIPEGTEWPNGYDDLHWEAGQFSFGLRRDRPDGAKGPKKAYANIDWWNLRWELTNQPTHARKEIERKEKELGEVIYRHSPKGRAERDAHWERYWRATHDQAFQAFKTLIPGLVPARRRRT